MCCVEKTHSFSLYTDANAKGGTIHPSFSASYNQWSRSQEGRVFTSLQFSDNACYLIYVCHLAWRAPQIYKLEHAGNDRIDLVASTCHDIDGVESIDIDLLPHIPFFFFPFEGQRTTEGERSPNSTMHASRLLDAHTTRVRQGVMHGTFLGDNT
jgi:hypothetical protein